MAAAARAPDQRPHIPVLLDTIISACDPIAGLWLDGTFGAGGYARALLEAGADPNLRDHEGNTAVDLARRATSSSAAETLDAWGS